MDNGGPLPSPLLTPRSYRCPRCGTTAPLRVSWPWWFCPQCEVRLIPADLYPVEEKETQPEVAGGTERRLDPGTPHRPVPQPNAPISGSRPESVPDSVTHDAVKGADEIP